MNEVRFIFSDVCGTYTIPCKVLNKILESNEYLIEYLDPNTQDVVNRVISSNRLVFPSFADLIIP